MIAVPATPDTLPAQRKDSRYEVEYISHQLAGEAYVTRVQMATALGGQRSVKQEVRKNKSTFRNRSLLIEDRRR